jgi:hypothetical protein
MTLHKLTFNQLEDLTYTLLAIHCALEDFRIAYLLNKYLQISLRRQEEDLDLVDQKIKFSLFKWIDKKNRANWNLISNVCKVEEEAESSSQSLFTVPNKIIRAHYLIPEYRNVNFFLKIDNDASFINEKALINRIQNIPQVVTTYSLDASQLKSKDNLIII